MEVVNIHNSGDFQGNCKNSDECLERAKAIGFKDLIVFGFTKEGKLDWDSTHFCRKDALWLIELTKKEILDL